MGSTLQTLQLGQRTLGTKWQMPFRSADLDGTKAKTQKVSMADGADAFNNLNGSLLHQETSSPKRHPEKAKHTRQLRQATGTLMEH